LNDNLTGTSALEKMKVEDWFDGGAPPNGVPGVGVPGGFRFLPTAGKSFVMSSPKTPTAPVLNS